MRRNIFAKVIGSWWEGPAATPKRPSLRVGDRVSLKACVLGLVDELQTPYDALTPYRTYVGYWYILEHLDGPTVGRRVTIPAPLIGRVFTRRGRIEL